MNKDDYGGRPPTSSVYNIQSINNLVSFKKEIRKIRVLNWFCNFANMVHNRGVLSSMVLSCN